MRPDEEDDPFLRLMVASASLVLATLITLVFVLAIFNPQ